MPYPSLIREVVTAIVRSTHREHQGPESRQHACGFIHSLYKYIARENNNGEETDYKCSTSQLIGLFAKIKHSKYSMPVNGFKMKACIELIILLFYKVRKACWVIYLRDVGLLPNP